MLTDCDKRWLEAIRESHRSWTPLVLAELRGVQPADLRQIAGQVLVFYNHMYVSARQLVEAVVQETVTQNGHVAEVYEYSCACAVHKLQDSLTPADGRAVMLASGYYGVDLDLMRTNADQAVRDAAQRLYEDWLAIDENTMKRNQRNGNR